MKNRFVKKNRDMSLAKELLMPIAMFLLIQFLFFSGISTMTRTTSEESLRSVTQAITKATVQCYAIEGQYPPDITYLEEHYGLVLDRGRYIIQYEAFASNIMPTIMVLPKDFSATTNTTNTDTEDGGLMDGAF